MKYRHLGNSWL